MGKDERVTVTKAKDLPKSGMMRLTDENVSNKKCVLQIASQNLNNKATRIFYD